MEQPDADDQAIGGGGLPSHCIPSQRLPPSSTWAVCAIVVDDHLESLPACRLRKHSLDMPPAPIYRGSVQINHCNVFVNVLALSGLCCACALSFGTDKEVVLTERGNFSAASRAAVPD